MPRPNKQTRYEAEVVIERPDGSRDTYKGDGVGPEESGDQLLAGAEQAALAQEPDGKVVESRVRRT